MAVGDDVTSCAAACSHASAVTPSSLSFADVHPAAFQDLPRGECGACWGPARPRLGDHLHFLLQSVEGTPLLTLLKDPYILVSAGETARRRRGAAEELG